MKSIPERLKIEDGKLKMIDGSSVEDYLCEWQRKQGLENGTSVSILSRGHLVALEDQAWLARNWAS